MMEYGAVIRAEDGITRDDVIAWLFTLGFNVSEENKNPNIVINLDIPGGK